MSDEPTIPVAPADLAAAARPPAGGADGKPPAGRGRRIAYRVVLGLTTVLAVLAVFGVWASRQLLDGEQWTDTSARIIENQAVRDTTADFLTDQIYASVDVKGALEGVLPGSLATLAGPVSGALRNVVNEAADKALASPAVQRLWIGANRLTHRQLVNVIEDKGRVLRTARGEPIVLDLRPIMGSVAVRAGLPATVQERLPADAGRIKILEADELSALQTAAKILKSLDWVLRVLVVLGFALAIWLARGRRRQALVAVGIAGITAGLFVLLLRTWAGTLVVDKAVKTESSRAAAEAVWTIATSLLRTLAWSLVVTAIPCVVMGLLLGPSRWAAWLRTRLAPFMRERQEVVYAAAFLAVVAFFAWAPIPTMRRPLTILLFFAIVVGGTYWLRRVTLEEHPEEPGAAGAAVSS